MSITTDVQTILADFNGYAKTTLTAAGNAADDVLTAAAAGVGSTVQKVEDDALLVLLDFVPSSVRAEVSAVVTPFVGGVETKLNAGISAAAAAGLAIAKARINATTGATH